MCVCVCVCVCCVFTHFSNLRLQSPDCYQKKEYEAQNIVLIDYFDKDGGRLDSQNCFCNGIEQVVLKR